MVYTIALEQFGQELSLKDLTFFYDPNAWVIQVTSRRSGTYNRSEYIWLKMKVNGTAYTPSNATFSYDLVQLDVCSGWDLDGYLTNAFNTSKNMFGYTRLQYDAYNPGNLNQPVNLVAIEFTFSSVDNFEVEVNFDTEGYFPNEQRDNNAVLQPRRDQFNADFMSKMVKSNRTNPEMLQCAKTALSNLLGSLQYSYGTIQIQQPDFDSAQDAKEMLSGTPSRLSFPRPFLWDEGFHNMLFCKWNYLICVESLRGWLNTSFPNGWIAREQPRGPELTSFITWLHEDNREANPPTFMLPVLYLHRHYADDDVVQAFFTENYEKMKQWFNWFLQTQGITDEQGDPTYFYKWWGPDETSNLGSGMDDYPRIDNTTFNDTGLFYTKYALDCHVWVMFFTDSMLELAQAQGDQPFVDYLTEISAIHSKNFETFFNQSANGYLEILTNGTINKSTPHLGYVSLFPLLFGKIPANNQSVLNTLYRSMINSSKLWSDGYGLRSLSADDVYYHQGSNYWRGPIWLNINFLTLRALKMMYQADPFAKQLYAYLRDDLISNVCYNNLQKFGYIFEHYDQNGGGRGLGNRHFTGWSSLIALIVGENYE
jgi:mannosyl-oligosaccharide glucosidase